MLTMSFLTLRSGRHLMKAKESLGSQHPTILILREIKSFSKRGLFLLFLFGIRIIPFFQETLKSSFIILNPNHPSLFEMMIPNSQLVIWIQCAACYGCRMKQDEGHHHHHHHHITISPHHHHRVSYFQIISLEIQLRNVGWFLTRSHQSKRAVNIMTLSASPGADFPRKVEQDGSEGETQKEEVEKKYFPDFRHRSGHKSCFASCICAGR